MNTIKHTCQIGLFCCLSLAAAYGGGDGKAFKHAAEEEKIAELTNVERKKENAAPLTLNAELSKIARAHSENMARQMKMDHVLDGKTPFDRINAAGLRYYAAGENVAWGPKKMTLPEVMEGWMDSEGHRKNILSADFTDIGVGIARSADGQQFFTQLFAKPKANKQ